MTLFSDPDKNSKKFSYVHSAGYIYVYRNGRYIAEHRLIYERLMNRPLRRDEVVHHRNANRRDNKIANLELISRSKHSKLHWTLKKAQINCLQLVLFCEPIPKQETLF